jgi:hypothetical protein
MTKQSGLGAAFYIDGVDLSGDIGSLSRINTARGVLPVTGINKSAFERLHAHRDGGMEFMSYFNDAAGAAHPTLKTRPTTDRIVTYLHRTTLGTPAAACIGKQVNYDPSRGEDGSLTYAITVESNGFGLEWGSTLTAADDTHTGAGSGTGVDFEAASSFGLQAYLHVLAFTGTDATVKLQESSDNGSGDAFADVTGGAFTQITTAPQAQRIQTTRALAVERYLRYTVTTSGGFSSLTLVVVVKKNTVLTEFGP